MRVPAPPGRGASGDELARDLAEGRLAGAERLDDVGVELRTGVADDLPAGVVPAPGRAVRPATRDRVERVCEREDPRAERDLLAREPVRVTRPVPALVVR